ncbi:hypothetical protein [Bosea sp. (in: a-proteobacteria)]|uniref:hypothetical protein n=1 Tax=Bosea sp. (in: a-proteobacteria) TaxID=1871050 RepID=UPI0027358718|nr:hypothetical protein [Bosea sp. (in: a-proteobacteria)]MDP3407775.1 hypothetical protein [Bosea sp. (in: a-proteobacteria)]
MIEAVMLVALGFLCASLLGLAVVPALNRRADRLARRRAEAAFPLSLAEIAADRDHLRAELALRARTLEQEAERGFAAKAAAMQELGRRDMKIGELDGVVRDCEARIAQLDGDLDATRGTLADTRAALARESAALVETSATLDRRIADLASLERDLADTRTSLTGTSADLSAREVELAGERETLGRSQALLAEREAELLRLRQDYDQMRVAQVEDRTRILVLDAKAGDLANRLTAREQSLADSEAALSAMTVDRDSERLLADALAARAEQAEAGLAAADARAMAAGAEALRIQALLAQDVQAHQADSEARQALEQELTRAKAALDAEREHSALALAGLREELRAREAQIETVHAEVQTLKGALEQSRAERARLKAEATRALKAGANAAVAAPEANAALRREIMAVAERLMNLPPQQEAAE